jgi:glycopeptide antibiotics resistance protein
MKHRNLHIALFMAYGALMLWLLFDRPGYDPGTPYWQQAAGHLNLIPFRTLRLFTDLLHSGVRSYIRMAIVNLGGNIIMFIPLGFLLPRIFSRLTSLPRVLLTTAILITAVEIIQLFTLVGCCDIDDLILNLIGSAIGYGFHLAAKKPAP